MIQKLRLRFVLNNMFIVLLLIIGILSLIMIMTKTNLEKDSLQRMREIEMLPDGPIPPDGIHFPFIRIRTETDGGIHSIVGNNYDYENEMLIHDLIETVNRNGKRTGTIDDAHLRFLIRKRPEETTYVFLDISEEQQTIAELQKACIMGGISGCMFFLILSIMLSFWITRPMSRAWEQQKQFIGDASHELKTPLTVILTNAELLQADSYSPEERRHFASSIQTMGEQMRGLVDEMLTLTHVEEEIASKNFQKINWSETVSEAVMQFEPVFFENSRSISSEIEKEIIVNGDALQLLHVTEILLDNAQKYSYPETDTHVCLRSQGSKALLVVENEGEKIKKEDLEKIFQRFYRVNPARSMNHSYGLGLAIAEKIITDHKGRIWAESNEGKNRFFVRLTCSK